MECAKAAATSPREKNSGLLLDPFPGGSIEIVSGGD
jgi:hypothetical protein